MGRIHPCGREGTGALIDTIVLPSLFILFINLIFLLTHHSPRGSSRCLTRPCPQALNSLVRELKPVHQGLKLMSSDIGL